MQDFVKRMVKEHSELVVKIAKLDEFLYGNGGLNIHTCIENNKTQDNLFRNMAEYANKCIQLSSMRTYLKDLEARLNNEGVFYEDGNYLERVAVLAQMEIEHPENEDTTADE